MWMHLLRCRGSLDAAHVFGQTHAAGMHVQCLRAALHMGAENIMRRHVCLAVYLFAWRILVQQFCWAWQVY